MSSARCPREWEEGPEDRQEAGAVSQSHDLAYRHILLEDEVVLDGQ